MKHKNWFWGTFFLLSAVFVVASQVGSFMEIGFLSILATVLLVALMVESIFHRNFFGIFVPMAFLYSIYQEPLAKQFDLMKISIWLLLLAAVLASTGLSIIFKKHPRVWAHKHSHEWKKHWKEVGTAREEHFSSSTETIDDNNPYAKVSFGSSSKYLHGNALKSGQFIVSFGSLEVYFDQATLDPDGAEIYLDCSFGAIQLYVPRHWKVRDSLSSSLGGVDNEAKYARPDENSPVLTLTGNVSLGGVEIHYI